MTEPSKEAVAYSDWFVWACPSCAEQFEFGEDGLPIEPCDHVDIVLDADRVQVAPQAEVERLEEQLALARQRWEQEVRERLLSELEKKRQWAVHGTNTPGDKLTEGEMVKGVPVVEIAGVNEAIDTAFDGTPEEAMSERIAATELKRAEGLKAIFGEAEPVEETDAN